MECAFSGNHLGRCLPPYWHLLRYRLLLSAHRDERWVRLERHRMADAVIKAFLRFYNLL